MSDPSKICPSTDVPFIVTPLSISRSRRIRPGISLDLSIIFSLHRSIVCCGPLSDSTLSVVCGKDGTRVLGANVNFSHSQVLTQMYVYGNSYDGRARERCCKRGYEE